MTSNKSYIILHHTSQWQWWQGSASDCVLVCLLAARYSAMKLLRQKHPFVEDGVLLSKLMAYCSKEVSRLFCLTSFCSLSTPDILLELLIFPFPFLFTFSPLDSPLNQYTCNDQNVCSPLLSLTTDDVDTSPILVLRRQLWLDSSNWEFWIQTRNSSWEGQL